MTRLKVGEVHSLRMLATSRSILCSLLLIVATCASASPANAENPSAENSAGFALTDPVIANYYRQHGGQATLGNPISNPMRLLGRRVQLFQRLALGVEPDGTVGPLNLVDGDLIPLASVAGPEMAVDPVLTARIPVAGSPHYGEQASAYVDAAAPNSWNGVGVRFASAFRSTLRCSDVVEIVPCDQSTVFALANDLWGLPTASPFSDPRNPSFVYLRFQRGIMVYSSTAGDTQWLLLGELFKQVLLGRPLPSDMLARIGASTSLARFYAQYDAQARDGVARPDELPTTSFAGAFSPASASRPQLDTRFGVAEGFQDSGLMAEVHAGWERVVLPWDQIQPTGPADFSHLGMTLSADRLRTEVARGIHVVGVLQFTPGWAQVNPSAGLRSVPKNLDLPFDDPQNYWGRFVYETARAYAGQIDEWIIWNEPDFRPSDAGGTAYTWAGSDEEFARLLAVAYQSAKKANPEAVVSFPATSYWVDETSSPKRMPFYERLLRLLTADPRAVENNLYHDAVALNLYRSPDDVYRVHTIFSAIQRRYGIDKPVWLTEMNAMPSDDAQSSCIDRQTAPGMKISLNQQAAFALQSFALAAAAGYQHVEFYSMSDGNNCQDPPWGLVRADGTRRPVADAVRTALSYFSHFTAVHFMPLVRTQEAWSAWPNNPNSYLPNWQVYQVAFDRPQNQRVTALWNGDGNILRVRIPKNGSSARVVDRGGVERTARAEDAAWVVELPPATAHFRADDVNADPGGYHVIGGDPVLLVEEGVDPATPVVPPRLMLT